jgi:hypothetical protein
VAQADHLVLSFGLTTVTLAWVGIQHAPSRCWPRWPGCYRGRRWLTVVAPEEPDGVQLVLHLADEPAQAFQAASRQAGRPVLSLRTHDCAADAERLKAKGAVFVKEPGPMAYGGTDAVLDNTCGNLINLHQD